MIAVTGQIKTPLEFEEALVVDRQSAGLKPSLLKPVIFTVEQGRSLPTRDAPLKDIVEFFHYFALTKETLIKYASSFRRKPESRAIKELDTGLRRCDE